LSKEDPFFRSVGRPGMYPEIQEEAMFCFYNDVS